jgi:hypothetical protein
MYFVPSYSEQTITRAYDENTTVQSFGFGDRTELEQDEKPKVGKDLNQLRPRNGKCHNLSLREHAQHERPRQLSVRSQQRPHACAAAPGPCKAD